MQSIKHIGRSSRPIKEVIRSKISRLSPVYFNPLGMFQAALPSFIIIGAQRAGTTSLHDYLSRHPQLVPSNQKEVHYFDNHYEEGLKWYSKNFSTQHHIDHLNQDGKPHYTFETTPYYLYHPAVPQRIHKDLPNIKLIALLRNPVERAFSHYKNEKRKGFEPLSFEDAIAAEPQRLAGEEERLLKDSSAYSYAHHHYSYVDRGRYDVQLERWMTLYSKDKILVIKSEDFFANVSETLKEVSGFLELDPFPAGSYEAINATSAGQKIPANVRTHLNALFAPHNRKLAEMTGMTVDWA